MVKKSFPIFKEAAEYTLNPYWKGVFMSCAEGKFPRGFTLSKSIIYINKGTKCLKYEMPTLPQEVLVLCKGIFENILGLQAEQEKQQDIIAFDSYQEKQSQTLANMEILQLKDVRKKEDKIRLIDEYTFNTGKQLNLSLHQKQKLKTAILTGLDLKIIKDIKFSENKIVKIPNLNLQKNGKTNLKIYFTQ